MIRTSISKVRAIIETELTDNEVFEFILTASALVDDVLKGKWDNEIVTDPSSYEDSSGGGIRRSLSEEIEKWLTAHLITTREQQIEQAGAGSATVKFQGATGLCLNGSRYGQMVKVLDTTGAFVELDAHARWSHITRDAYIMAVEE